MLTENDLKLPIRVANILCNNRYDLTRSGKPWTVRQLNKLTDEQMLAWRGFGPRSLKQLREVLKAVSE